MFNLQTRQIHKSSQSGFTLTELMITVAIMGILASIAIPSMTRQLAEQRMKNTSALIFNALKEAKAENYLRKSPVDVVYDENTSTIALRSLDPTDPDRVRMATMATYTMNDSSEVTIDPVTQTTVTLSNNGRTANIATYTVCDSRITGENGRRVVVDAIANITIDNAGIC